MGSRLHAAAGVGGLDGGSGAPDSALVSAEELRALATLAEPLASGRDEILAHWREQAERTLGADSATPADELALLLRRDLDGLVVSLREGSAAPFAEAASLVGGELVDRGLPFARAVAAACFLSEATLTVVGAADAPAQQRILQKLGHYRVLLLADQYFRCGIALVSAADRPSGETSDGGVDESVSSPQRYGLVGDSPPMRDLYRGIESAARGHSTVFIVGESGTGKELTARAVHERSARAKRPLVVVNCAALPAGLFESELFGHREGAYTGAQHSHAGLVRAAAGGSLFLDEITEMPASVQAKLLRVLEEGTVRPVGTTEEIPAQVRFIASTNRDPEEAVRAGVLRASISSLGSWPSAVFARSSASTPMRSRSCSSTPGRAT